MAKPFYGVDGNLLVDDLPHDHAVVEAILDGRFKPTYWAQQMLPDHLFTKYPQLAMSTQSVRIGAPTTRSWRRETSSEDDPMQTSQHIDHHSDVFSNS
jgi:hypothetical protein